MHKNYRRKVPTTIGKRNAGSRFLGLSSAKEMKRQEAKRRRARERLIMVAERYDNLWTKVPRDILWYYW